MTHADSIWAKALELHSDSLQSKVDSLQAKLDGLQGKTDFLSNVIETANDGVSNQLSATNNFLALIAVIVTIAAIWLGVLIEKRKRQIESMAKIIDEKKNAVESIAKVVDDKKRSVEVMSNIVDSKKETVESLAETVDKKKNEVETLAKATEELDKKISSNLSSLYKDLRAEETKTLFQRLVAEPQDIVNLERLLLAREVNVDNFHLLKEAFLHLPDAIKKDNDQDDYDNVKHSFMLQFFQHFFYLSLKDDDIRPVFTDNFKNVFNNGYESDIKRATEGLCKALTDADSKFDKIDVLTKFLKAINTCKFKNFALLKKILENKLSEQGLLEKAINHCKADKVDLPMFGLVISDETKK